MSRANANKKPITPFSLHFLGRIFNKKIIVKSGTLLTSLQGHTSSVWSVCFSPDGTLLASGSDDKTIKIWDVKSGTNLTSLQGHDGHQLFASNEASNQLNSATRVERKQNDVHLAMVSGNLLWNVPQNMGLSDINRRLFEQRMVIFFPSG
jgi:WD40 repeat protein